MEEEDEFVSPASRRRPAHDSHRAVSTAALVFGILTLLVATAAFVFALLSWIEAGNASDILSRQGSLDFTTQIRLQLMGLEQKLDGLIKAEENNFVNVYQAVQRVDENVQKLLPTP
jgi:hypothetical protein